MFHHQCWMPLGNGLRVPMEKATRTDVNVWTQLSFRNTVKVERADRKIQKYGRSRNREFLRNPHIKTLGELERKRFGYQEPFDLGIEPEADAA